MCMSCGCNQQQDDHGDPRHLTLKDLEQAADAAGISVRQVVQNIHTSLGHAGSASPSGGQEPSGPESI